MHIKATYEKKVQHQLQELKEEISALKNKAAQVETNLQLEYYTLIDELQVKLEIADQKFHLLTQAGEDDWEEFKTEFEQVWDSMRELIKSITSP
jgi:predicted ribosome quality control (RQC) complex YloA/Tae2 family protein